MNQSDKDMWELRNRAVEKAATHQLFYPNLFIEKDWVHRCEFESHHHITEEDLFPSREFKSKIEPTHAPPPERPIDPEKPIRINILISILMLLNLLLESVRIVSGF